MVDLPFSLVTRFLATSASLLFGLSIDSYHPPIVVSFIPYQKIPGTNLGNTRTSVETVPHALATLVAVTPCAISWVFQFLCLSRTIHTYIYNATDVVTDARRRLVPFERPLIQIISRSNLSVLRSAYPAAYWVCAIPLRPVFKTTSRYFSCRLIRMQFSSTSNETFATSFLSVRLPCISPLPAEMSDSLSSPPQRQRPHARSLTFLQNGL